MIRIQRLSVALLLLPLACGDDSGRTSAESFTGADGGETQSSGMDSAEGMDGAEDPSGDGDGDPSGDGDGDPTTTGDGDGDPTTTGDGDGDPCPIGEPSCPCTPGGGCDPGLVCEAGVCEAVSSTGDGDGDPSGDGDGDPSGDGDGDPTKPYQACPGGKDSECGANEICVTGAGQSTNWSICTSGTCSSTGDCTATPDNVCADAPGDGVSQRYCLPQICGNNNPCPDAMQCFPGINSNPAVCLWPE